MTSKTTHKAKALKAAPRAKKGRRAAEGAQAIPGLGGVGSGPARRNAEEEARFKTLLAEIDRTFERLAQQQAEIDRLAAASSEALTRLRAA